MDLALIHRAQAGDTAALVALLQARNDKLYRTAYLYLHNQADALDAVQEASLQAMLNIHKLKHPEYFDTWLIRIVMNCAFKMYRRQPPSQPPAPVTDTAAASDLHADLTRDLARLPRRYQEVIVLYYYNDLPLAAVAKSLHLPLGTVKSRLNRGLALLRKEGAVHHEYGL